MNNKSCCSPLAMECEVSSSQGKRGKKRNTWSGRQRVTGNHSGRNDCNDEQINTFGHCSTLFKKACISFSGEPEPYTMALSLSHVYLT